ncbi:malonate decarboxylase holo-ACP synthase [Metabacillus arenae]|uniref:Malonate decarboxylase holo-ACP synthase n=1 Tax=Metabacillus arenae TaxID=2771434 RepID=A0A926NKC2_9BACI|nr:malonate decarboxylase holo-ACP synthase [Metabacillus arenae]MBD1379431.1 malonate decarboxylase holo-ACP synthase [Metabacillus arenae]
MELNPHDLLEINNVTDLTSFTPFPEWVEKSIAAAPFVVVRRAQAGAGKVAVGVRGTQRNERFAAFLTVDRIVRRITPEQLAVERKWVKQQKNIFQCLDQINELMNNYSLVWGPAGSVGFELASDKETTTKTSDIDIVIRFTNLLTKKLASELEAELNKITICVDVQVETEYGAFSLNEYAASGDKPILVRTMNGPLLKKIENHETEI